MVSSVSSYSGLAAVLPIRPAGAPPAAPEVSPTGKPRESAKSGVDGPQRPLIDGHTLTSVQQTDAAKPAGAATLTDEEKQVVDRLRKEDTRVKSHERAHASAAGSHGGAPSYQYETGPDGKRYAIGGEVPIDVSPENDPRATIQKMEMVKRAALAPSDPSSADRAVAAEADKQAQEAKRQLRQQQEQENLGQAPQAGAAETLAAPRRGARDGLLVATQAYGRAATGGSPIAALPPGTVA